MGEVFKVWDRRLKRTLVAKTILSEGSNPQEQRELRKRFRREAELASQLAHPNIVQIFDLVPEGPWIIMEFVEGPTLRDLLAERPLAIGLDSGDRPRPCALSAICTDAAPSIATSLRTI